MTGAVRPDDLARLIEEAARGALAGVPPMPERAADLFGETGWLRLLVPAAAISQQASADLEERLVKAEDAWNRQVLDLLHRLTRMEAAASDLDESDPAQETYRGVLRAQIDVLGRHVRDFSYRDARGFLTEVGLLGLAGAADGAAQEDTVVETPAEPAAEVADAAVDTLVARIGEWAAESDGAAAGWQVTVPDDVQRPGVLLRRADSPPVAVYLDSYDGHPAAVSRIADDAAERAALRAAGTVVFQLTADDLAATPDGAPYEQDAQAAARNGYRVLGGDPAELDDLIWAGGARTLRAFLADPAPDRWRRVATGALAGILVRPGGWRVGLDDDNFAERVRGALLADPLPPGGGQARTLVRVLDARGCLLVAIIDQREPGPRAPLGSWTGLAVLDDRLPAIRSSEAAHRRRWAAWLHWGNLLQFLAGPGQDGRQLAYSRLDDFDPRTLAAAAVVAPVAGGFVRARAGAASPSSLASLFPADPLEAAEPRHAEETLVQRAIAERAYDGPALVTGGPGAGKTSVALHRARYLAERRGVLFATFNKQLAGIARQWLLDLGGPGIAGRVEVVTIDALAARLAAPQPGQPWQAVLREAERAERARAEREGRRYRHLVVDEAQDLTAGHLTLLRALVAPGPDDLFLTGDPGQRIYGDEEILDPGPVAGLGISVAGRTAELTDRCRPAPEVARHGLADWRAELAEIARQVTDWLAACEDRVSIGIAVPDLAQVTEVVNYLDRHGIVVSAIGADGPRVPDSVHVGTLQRFKGLEYQRMYLAGLTAQAPLTAPLLRMATTRATGSLTLSWHGEPSGFADASLWSG